MIVGFNIDLDTLTRFNEKLKSTGESADEVIVELIEEYIEYKEAETNLLENLFVKFDKVEKLVDVVLRRLLEEGVANGYALDEMQKASGNVQIQKFNIFPGFYNNQHFKIAFPLLVNEDGYFVDKSNFFDTPLLIRGKKFYLYSQWSETHRDAIKKWISTQLSEWFRQADDDSADRMEDWIRKLANTRD